MITVLEHAKKLLFQGDNRRGIMYVDAATVEGLKASDLETSASKDDFLFNEEYTFYDGVRVAIQVARSTDPHLESYWTQGVFYAQDGTAMGCTEPSESFLRNYHSPAGDYALEVRIGDSNQQITSRRLSLCNRFRSANENRELWFVDERGNGYFFPHCWALLFLVASGNDGGLDRVDKETGLIAPELYGYAPIEEVPNAEVDTAFVCVETLARLRETTREEACRRHPNLRAWAIDEI